MYWDGPIGFAVAAANDIAWAHYFSGSCCRCLRMGPLDLGWQLPMALLGPITFPAGATNALG
jgi:hypothetical protein